MAVQSVDDLAQLKQGVDSRARWWRRCRQAERKVGPFDREPHASIVGVPDVNVEAPVLRAHALVHRHGLPDQWMDGERDDHSFKSV